VESTEIGVVVKTLKPHASRVANDADARARRRVESRYTYRVASGGGAAKGGNAFGGE